MRHPRCPSRNCAGNWKKTEDLGVPPEAIFAEFDTEPLAAASIAQVHRARLKDSRMVVVKIRRPGIKRVVEADLHLMRRLARIATNENPETQRFRPNDVVHQFGIALRRELDLAHECRNAVRVAESLTDRENIVVPKVYWQWTCERVNVQEYIEGINGRDMQACRYLVIDFGTSKSPKSTRQRGSQYAPAALRPLRSAQSASHSSHNGSTALGCVCRTSLRAAAKTPGAYRGLSASGFALPWRTALESISVSTRAARVNRSSEILVVAESRRENSSLTSLCSISTGTSMGPSRP